MSGSRRYSASGSHVVSAFSTSMLELIASTRVADRLALSATAWSSLSSWLARQAASSERTSSVTSRAVPLTRTRAPS